LVVNISGYGFVSTHPIVLCLKSISKKSNILVAEMFIKCSQEMWKNIVRIVTIHGMKKHAI